MNQTSEISHGPQGVVAGGHIHVAEGAARLFVPGQQNKPEPQIQLLREGNVVKAIEVVCTCGQRVRLKCVYS